MSCRLEAVYEDDESALKAARQLQSSSFSVRSISWRRENTLSGAVTVLSAIVQSSEATRVSEFVASKHPMAEPEISLFVIGLQGEKRAAPVETVRFTTPLNDRIVNASSAAEFSKQYLSARFFPHIRIENAFNEDLLEDVYDALAAGGNFETRANDLYLFSQSEDLRTLGEKHPRIAELASVLYSTQMVSFLSKVSGIELNSQVDMSATLYTNGCHLLTHDDRNDTRRVAFILYLTPKQWTESDGGSLRFFGSDPKNFNMPDPNQFEDYLPLWGHFAFFTVGPNSFHTVREVTSKLPRVAISGWFHGAELQTPQLVPVMFPKLEYFPPILKCPKFAVNPLFQNMKDETSKQLMKKLRVKGAVLLTDFLMPSFLEEFPLSESAWSECGPLHLRHYLRCENPTGKLHAIQTVLMSSQFVSFLSNLSGTNLVFESWEIRKFERGKHYTLLHDHVEDGASVDSSTLDVCFTILDPPCSNDIDWEMSFGGFVSYVDSNPKDEDDDDKEGGDDALMTLFPLHNSLSVVVCEKGIVSFTKYLSASAPSNRIDFVAKFQLGDPIEQLQMEFSSMSESEQEEGEGEEEKPTKKLKY